MTPLTKPKGINRVFLDIFVPPIRYSKDLIYLVFSQEFLEKLEKYGIIKN